MKQLLRYRADVNQGNADDLSAFHIAAANANVDFLEFLLQRGKADLLNNTGVLLQKAMLNEDKDVFKFIVREMEAAVKKGKKSSFHVT